MSCLTPLQTHNLTGDVFLTARKAFLDSLPANEKCNFEQCRTSKELLVEAKKFNSFRTKKKEYAKPIEKLRRFSDHLKPYFEIIEIAITSNPDVAALVWSAIRLIFKLASNFGTFFDKLSDLLEVYGEKLPRFEKIDKLAKNNFSDMFRDTLKTIYIDLFELFTAIARIFTKADGCKLSLLVSFISKCCFWLLTLRSSSLYANCCVEIIVAAFHRTVCQFPGPTEPPCKCA
jgi:hypothetical protein